MLPRLQLLTAAVLVLTNLTMPALVTARACKQELGGGDGQTADADMRLQVLRYAQATESGQGPKPRAAAKSDVTAEEIEITFWNTVKDSNDPALLEAYLDRFPNGNFAPLARRHLQNLKPGPIVQPPAEQDPQAGALRERVFRAVVQISVIKPASVGNERSAQSEIISKLPEALKGSPFEKDFYEVLKNVMESAARGKPTASGFIIDPSGYIVTTNAAVAGSESISVELHDGTKLRAVAIVGLDPRTDLALLKGELPSGSQTLRFGDSNRLKAGDWVAALGNPDGQPGSIISGRITAISKAVSGSPYPLIESDLRITAGYGGSPLLNADGEVVGVNAAIKTPAQTGTPVGSSYSVPSKLAARVVDQLRAFGEVRRAWLGSRIQDVNQEIANAFGLAETRGAIISEPVTGGPAAAAKLRASDVVLEINGAQIKDSRDLALRISELLPGESVRLKVWRGGAEQEVTVTLGTFPSTVPSEASKASSQAVDEAFGSLLLSPMTQTLRSKFAISSSVEGLVITAVAENSAAAQKGLKPGDVVRKISQAQAHVSDDVSAQIAAVKSAGRKTVLLEVANPSGEVRFVVLDVSEIEGEFNGKRGVKP